MSKQSRAKSRRHKKYMGTVMINDDFKKNVTGKFEWLSETNTQRVHTNSTKDITLTEVAKKKDGTIRYNITLRNKTYAVLGDFVDLAMYKNRIFFKSSTPSDRGYKVYKHATTKGNPFIQITQNKDNKRLSEFVGDYDFKYDEFYELYYIEKA